MMMNSENINELAAALAKAQGEMRHADKNKTMKMPGRSDYKYASLSSVIEAIRDPLSKNGLAVIQQLSPHDGKLFLITKLVHSSGQWVASYMPIKSDIIKPQDFGSELTYKKRYSLCALICQDSDEDDDGSSAQKEAEESIKNETHKTTPAKSPVLIKKIGDAQLVDIVEWIGDDKEWGDKILSAYKVSKLADLPESAYIPIKTRHEERSKCE